MSDTPAYTLSPYERLREARIARNNAMLSKLGLLNASQIMKKTKKPQRTVKRKRAVSTDVRSSSRLTGKTYNFSDSTSRSKEEIEEEREEKLRRKEENERAKGEKKMSKLLKQESKRREQEKAKAVKDLRKEIKEMENKKKDAIKSKEGTISRAKRAFERTEFEQFQHICKKDENPNYTHPNMDPGYPSNKKEIGAHRKNALSALNSYEGKKKENLKKMNESVGDVSLNSRISKLAKPHPGGEKKEEGYWKVLPQLGERPEKVPSRVRAAGGPIGEGLKKNLRDDWLSEPGAVQAGDVILYFAEGHKKFLDVNKDKRAEKLKLKNRVPLWRRWESKNCGWGKWEKHPEGLGRQGVKCVVEKVDHEFPLLKDKEVEAGAIYPVIANITLRPLETPTGGVPASTFVYELSKAELDEQREIEEEKRLEIAKNKLRVERGKKPKIKKMRVVANDKNLTEEEVEKEELAARVKTEPNSNNNINSNIINNINININTPVYKVDKTRTKPKYDFDTPPPSFICSYFPSEGLNNFIVPLNKCSPKSSNIQVNSTVDFKGKSWTVTRVLLTASTGREVWNGVGLKNGDVEIEVGAWEIDPSTSGPTIQLDANLRKKAVEMLTVVGETDLGVSFDEVVTDEIAESYTSYVPIAFSLKLVQARIQSNFYRHVEGVVDDLRRIHDICALYNEPSAIITIDALLITNQSTQALMEIVKNEQVDIDKAKFTSIKEAVLGGKHESPSAKPTPKKPLSNYDDSWICKTKPDQNWTPQVADYVQYSFFKHRRFIEANKAQLNAGVVAPNKPDSAEENTDTIFEDEGHFEDSEEWETAIIEKIDYEFSPVSPTAIIRLQTARGNKNYTQRVVTVHYKPDRDNEFLRPLYANPLYKANFSPNFINAEERSQIVGLLVELMQRAANGDPIVSDVDSMCTLHAKPLDPNKMNTEISTETKQNNLQQSLLLTDSKSSGVSLDTVIARLRNNYYRSKKAAEDDIMRIYGDRANALLNNNCSLGSKFVIVSALAGNGEDVEPVLASLGEAEREVLKRLTSASIIYNAAICALTEPELTLWLVGWRAEGRVLPEAESVLAPAEEAPLDEEPTTPMKPAAPGASVATTPDPTANFPHVRGSVDINSVDHALLPPDPANGHPKIEAGVKWPDVKIKITVGGVIVEPATPEGGGAAGCILVGDDYINNSALTRAIYGKPGRFKSCYRCKCDRQGFMVCRVRRGHTHIDFIQEKLERGASTPRTPKSTVRGVPGGFNGHSLAMDKRPMWKPNSSTREIALSDILAWRETIKTATESTKEFEVTIDEAKKNLRNEESKIISVDVDEIMEQQEASNAILDLGDDHDDQCMLCGGEGELLMCDGCPKCVHLECIGLKTISEDEDWFCGECVIRIRSANVCMTTDTKMEDVKVEEVVKEEAVKEEEDVKMEIDVKDE